MGRRHTFGFPPLAEDGSMALTLPCGHADEVLTAGQLLDRQCFRTACPLCETPYIVIIVTNHELDYIGITHWRSPTGVAVAIAPAPEDIQA